MAPAIACIAPLGSILGEGPVWDDRSATLYWVDIKGRKTFRLGADERLSEWPTPLRVGSLAPQQSGGFIGGTDKGIAVIHPETERFEIVANPEEQLPGNRFNDGKVDRRGRFWAGTMDDSEREATGALYCFDRDLSWSAVDRGYKVTNGPAFSPLGTTTDSRAGGASRGQPPLASQDRSTGRKDRCARRASGGVPWLAPSNTRRGAK